MHIPRFVKFCSVVAACFCFIVVFTDEGSTRERGHKYNNSIQVPQYQQSNKTYRQYQQKNKKRSRYQQKNKRREGRGSYFHKHGYKHLNIGAKHYPRLGECRIWYPNRHRSSRIRCGQKPPRGAWLLERPKNRPNNVYVEVYEPRQQGVVFTLGEFEIHTGAFVREILNR